ncbi:type-1 angiotensin II receptor-associated protein isoform X2 [Rhincodon typus]|uniref:type-1 angiotensin II receptor-associated protein isoform X2 n=1 Tax=Rhincodon typus TaxID=259920 RepID=UPI00202DF0E2|nr:type-1 angiotensin II receptor-associated protein isoform X2 [Rhincodon typus]
MELPVVSLKMIIVVHWLLTTCYLRSWTRPSLKSSSTQQMCKNHSLLRGYLYPWLPQPYLWSNYAILAIGVWAIAQRDSVDAVVMYLVGMLITVLMDIIHIAISYDRLAGKQIDIASRDQFRFSVGMTILSLLLKPISCFFVYQMYKERGGDYNLNFDLDNSIDSRFTCDSVESGAHYGRSY